MPTANLMPKLKTWVEEAIEEVADRPCLYDIVLTVTDDGPVFSVVLYVDHEGDTVEVWSTSRFPSRLTYEEVKEQVIKGLWVSVLQQVSQIAAKASNGHAH